MIVKEQIQSNNQCKTQCVANNNNIFYFYTLLLQMNIHQQHKLFTKHRLLNAYDKTAIIKISTTYVPFICYSVILCNSILKGRSHEVIIALKK